MAIKLGNEFGIKPRMMLIADPQFSIDFRDADCRGMMYIFGIDEPTGFKEPVQIGFLFKNDPPASKFLDTLIHWSGYGSEDTDSVGIDFIEKDNGEYIIAIYLKPEALINKMVPDRLKEKIDPLVIGSIHFKSIDTGANFTDFKLNYKQGQKVAVGYYIGTPGSIEKQSNNFIIKHNFGFYNEHDNDISYSVGIYNKTNSKQGGTRISELSFRFEISEELLDARRSKEMGIYFPVTIHKINNKKWLENIFIKLSSKYNRNEITQAICNMILFERMGMAGINEKNVPKIGYAVDLLDYLSQNYETFTSYFPQDSFFTPYKVEAQICRDRKQRISLLTKKTKN